MYLSSQSIKARGGGLTVPYATWHIQARQVARVILGCP